jgi:signal transduction histidine kinase
MTHNILSLAILISATTILIAYTIACFITIRKEARNADKHARQLNQKLNERLKAAKEHKP